MASVTANVLNVQIVKGDDSAITSESEIKLAAIFFDTANIAVTGGTDTIALACNTAIQNKQRNGKTVTCRANMIAPFQPGAQGTTLLNPSATLSTNTATVTPKASDWSTNASITTSAVDRPMAVLVAFTEA